MQQQTEQIVRASVDVATGATVIGIIVGWITPLAAFAALVVSALRVYEMVTGKPAKTLFDRFRRN